MKNAQAESDLEIAFPVTPELRAEQTVQHDINTMNADLFTKRIDEHGRFYHIIKETGEITYDTPHGDNVPLETQRLSPTDEEHEMIQRQQKAIQKEIKRKERLELTRRIQSQHAKKQDNLQLQRQEEESARLDELWRTACESSKGSGVVGLNWRELGYISQRIYDFEKNYGVVLRKLSLNGNDLSFLESLPSQCRTLEVLSLASNHIQVLDPEIQQMQALRHLNLVRNGLVTLPDSIGCLKQLQVLDLSNNKLVELPQSFASLDALKILRVECNQLTQLPENVALMNLEEMNVQSNQISVLPRKIGSVKCLKVLLANDNCLRNLPIGICNSSIRMLHVSRNNIMELPKAFQNLVTLESLWMDFNKLSALPHGFHHLTRLQDLKLDGNIDLVFPPTRVITKGAKEVLKWCEMRLASNEFSRQRNIVLSVLSLLEQVAMHRIGGGVESPVPHESIYEKDVLYKEDKYHQFDSFNTLFNNFVPAMEKIWSESDQSDLKGAITSFPYERKEVEHVLSEFKDAGGKIVQVNKQALFRRCTCVDKVGRKRVCVPPKVGWMCKRRAIMVRVHFVLESTMVERRRIQIEMTRIEEATEAAKKAAKLYLDSEEGHETVRHLAEQRVVAEISESKPESIRLEQLSLETIIASVDIATLRSKSQRSTSTRTRKQHHLRVQPLGLLTSCFNRVPIDDDDVAEEIKKIRNDFLTNEVNTRRSGAIETNIKMKKVMDAWIGTTIEDIFSEWKIAVEHIKRERKKSQRLQAEEQKRLQDEKEAQLLMAKKELSLWTKYWDEFNDRPYWSHSLTGENTLDEPTLTMVQSRGWTHPELRARRVRRLEASGPHTSVTSSWREGRLEKEAFEAAKRVLERRRGNLEKT